MDVQSSGSNSAWAVNSLSPLGTESRGLVERIQHKGQPDGETEKDENFRAKFISSKPLKQDQSSRPPESLLS